MREPPLGYDDSYIVPRERMVALLDAFEERLNAVQRIFQQHFPGEFRVSEDFQGNFWDMEHSAHELGTEHLNFVRELITSYQTFQKTPSAANLEEVYGKLRKLRKFLRG